MTSLLRNKVETFTVRPGRPLRDEEAALLVLVPPKADLQRGFELARSLRDQKQEVRLVGYGATLAGSWPAWIAAADGILLTELGAYCHRPPEECVAELRSGLSGWIDEVFEGVLPFSPSKIFYAGAALRVFQPVFDAAPIVAGLAARHPGATVHCIENGWSGLGLLQSALSQTGGRLVGVERSPSPPGRLRLAAAAAARIAGAAALQIRAYLRAAPARAELRRRSQNQQQSPSLWVAVMADWPRANHHFMNSFIRPELAQGTKMGALLFGDLSPGTRSESDLRKRTGDELWPGMGELRDSSRGCVTVEQVVGPASPVEFFRSLAYASRASLRVATRGLARLPALERIGLPIRTGGAADNLAQLFSIDVFRAVAASQAVRKAALRHSFAGKCVVLTASVLPEHAAADVTLQSLGATTVEFYHGAGLDLWVGGTESASQYRNLFTHADAASVEALGQPCLVAGMPLESSHGADRRRTATDECRLLILSNYCHRDYTVDGRLPFEPYQTELHGVIPPLQERFPKLKIRWRPHPADNEAAIGRALGRLPAVERSPNRALQGDLAWADVVISTMSTTLLESLFVKVPLFIHVAPEYRDGQNGMRYDPSRTFFYARDGAPKIAAVIADLERGIVDGCRPESEERVAFFGPTGAPRQLGEILRERGWLTDDGRIG